MSAAAQTAQAKYDLNTLPLRQGTLKHMMREPWQSVEAIKILRDEFEKNAARIEKAKEVLGVLGAAA